MEGTRHLLLLLRRTLFKIRDFVAVHPAKILQQHSETTTPLFLIWRLYPIQPTDASPCRQLHNHKSQCSRQEIALSYVLEPKTELKDYPTLVDLDFALNLPTPILPF